MPFWLAAILWGAFLISVGVGLTLLFSGPAMERKQLKTDKTAVLRSHYPMLSGLFAQWDECTWRPVAHKATARICDHKMIKGAATIDKTADMLSFLQARDAIYASVDGADESEQ